MTIRRRPGDFEVHERVAARFLEALAPIGPGTGAESSVRAGASSVVSAGGGHVVFELAKTSLTTPEGVGLLARALGVPPGMIDYAGLKDKHAVTTQLVSVPSAALSGASPGSLFQGPRWSARRIGVSPDPVTAEVIDGNRFTIVVRGLILRDVREMGRRASLLRLEGSKEGPSTLLFVNYFGDQRFGSARHGKGWIARELIAGRFEEALRLAIGTPARKDTGARRAFTRLAATHWGDWDRLEREWPRCSERAAIETMASMGDARRAFAALPHLQQQIAVEAYQSYLWNRAACRMVEGVVEPRARLEADDDFGSMVFAAARGMPPALLGMSAALPSARMPTADLWGRTMLSVLSAEGLKPEDLRIPGLRRPEFGEAVRPLAVPATGFLQSSPEADDLDDGGKRLKVTLAFELPRGAYATVLLRALGQ